MKIKECCRYSHISLLLLVLLTIALSMGACTSPAKAKAQYLSRGEALLKEKKYQEATIEFRNALQLDERLAGAHWGLAQAYEGLQRYQEAFGEMLKTAELDPNNLDVRVKMGGYYLAGGKQSSAALGEAERLAKDVLQKDPKHIEGHILMGSVLFAQNRHDEALAALNHAIQLDTKRVESYLSLARFYVSSKETGKAEETFQLAIRVNGTSGLAHSEYGKFLAQASRPEAAEAEFQKAVELEPANRDSRFVLASFYLVNKQFLKLRPPTKRWPRLIKTNQKGEPCWPTTILPLAALTTRLTSTKRSSRTLLTSPRVGTG